MAIPYVRQKTWADNTGQQVDANWLNYVEASLVSALGIAPLTNGALVWDGTQFRADAKIAAANIAANTVTAAQIAAGTITNNEIAAGAAIAKTKLASLGIVDADVAAGAAIAQSKIALATNAVVPVILKKTTAKTVNTTVAATDLLNAEITVPILSATSTVRLTAYGDWLQNSGGSVGIPRFSLVLNGVTFIDTGAPGATATTAGAPRFPWWIDALIQNTATNAQIVTFRIIIGLNENAGITNAFATGNGFYNEGAVSTSGWAWGLGNNTGLAVDTTVARALVLNVVNPSASAACETKLFGAAVEIL